MNHYAYSPTEVDTSIDEAQHVGTLLQVAHEQVNIARYVAERVQLGDSDSYMNARAQAAGFSTGFMAETFIKDSLLERDDGRTFIALLARNGLIDADKFEFAHRALLAGTSKTWMKEHLWAKCVVVNEQSEWLYTLSKVHAHVARAERSKKLFRSSAVLMEALYILAHFVSDLGSTLVLNPAHMDEPAVVKACLHGINAQLAQTILLLCHSSKTGGPLRQPVSLSDGQYFDRYYFHLKNVLNGFVGAKRRLTQEIGILTSVTLVTEAENDLPMQRCWDD